MIETILSLIVLFGPAGLANISAEQSRHIPGSEFLAKPMDFNLTLRGKPLFGKNKTIRGLIFGILIGTLSAILIKWLYLNVGFFNANLNLDKLVPGSFENFNYVLFGFLASIGTIFGDAIESSFKRQLDIAPGKPFFPFDQTDYILGAALLTLPLLRMEAKYYAILIGLFFVLHLVGKYIGFKMGIGKTAI